MFPSIAYAAIAFLASLVTASPDCECTPDSVSKLLHVDSTNGPITGHLVDDHPCVVEYLGIPYAKPPVGKLRFAAPEPYSGHHPYEAANYGFDCPLTPSPPVDFPGFFKNAQRIISFFTSGTGKPQSEDCLTLNVWSQVTERADKGSKPVYVFFYGGRLTVGSTDTPFYHGSNFAAAEDVVVITVNYRINIFGFPGSNDLTQNLGIRDMRLAIEWVRDNAKQFGGDPSKITISGQSAGGVGVDYLTYAYESDPIFAAAITHSGNAFSFPLPEPGVQEKNWGAVVSAVGCANAANELHCMRQADWKDIKAAAAGVAPGKSNSVLRSVPAFYAKPDHEIIFSNYTKRTEQGRYAKVPILFGNTNFEAGFYAIATYANTGSKPTMKQESDFILSSFTCPVAHQAASRRNDGVPAWAFRYMADWRNTRLYPTSGAYHGVDMHMIFGNSAVVSGRHTSKAQKQLTKNMQKAWFTFMDNPQSGLKQLGWPEFNQDKKTLMLWGNNNAPDGVLVRPSRFDAKCPSVTLGALDTAPADVVAAVENSMS